MAEVKVEGDVNVGRWGNGGIGRSEENFLLYLSDFILQTSSFILLISLTVTICLVFGCHVSAGVNCG